MTRKLLISENDLRIGGKYQKLMKQIVKNIFVVVMIIFLGASCNKKPSDPFSGTWQGLISFEENVVNPQCQYTSQITLEIPQPPSQQTGKFTLELIEVNSSGGACCNKQKFPTKNVRLEIVGQSISWNDSIVKFEGNLSEPNKMILNFESCPNQVCSDGVRAKGVIGNGQLSRE